MHGESQSFNSGSQSVDVIDAEQTTVSSRPYRRRVVTPLYPPGQRAAVDDVHRLKELHRSAVRVSSLDAFGRLLDQEQD